MESEVTEESLQTLLEASRTPEGRVQLSATATLPSLLRRLPSSSSASLLSLLRLLRNLCAGDLTLQNSFIDLEGPNTVAAALKPGSTSPEILRVGLQALGNAALGGERQKVAIWARFFPESFLEFAGVRDAGVCGVLCMVLDTCCSGGDEGRTRLAELCQVEHGINILKEIITTAVNVGCWEEWLEWLFCKACIEEPYFSVLFSKLGSSHDSNCCSSRFNRDQAFILYLLSNFLSERPKEVTISHHFVVAIFEVLKEASEAVDFSSKGESPLPTGSPAIDILGYSLILLKDICASECPIDIEAPIAISNLLDEGILELLLGFLRDLGPPTIVRKSMLHGRNRDTLHELPDPLKWCPYKGFRRDVVAVISNCTHRWKRAQDEIRKCGGILLLLQQCVVDEDSPFLREWGIMAVRNLLEGNEENQLEVAELRLQGAVDTPEISSLGLRVEIDEESGHAKLVNTS